MSIPFGNKDFCFLYNCNKLITKLTYRGDYVYKKILKMDQYSSCINRNMINKSKHLPYQYLLSWTGCYRLDNSWFYIKG